MSVKKFGFCSIVAFFPLAATATPEVDNPGNNDFVQIISVPGQADTYEMTLRVDSPSGFANFVIYTDNSNDVIQKLTIEYNPAVTPNQGVVLSFRDPVIVDDRTNFASIESIIPDIRVHTRVTVIKTTGDLGRNVLGDSGEILLDAIGAINILGDWYADVVIDDQEPSAAPSEVTAFVDGDVLGGSLLVATGQVDIMSVAGDVKDTLSTFGLWGKDRVSRLVAGSVDEIEINAPIGFSDPEMNLFNIDGDFLSSVPMSLNKLAGLSGSLANNAGGMVIDGDYGAEITVNTPLGESNPQTGVKSKYFIEGSFLSGAELNVPADGLTPQIFINKAMNGGSWETGGVIDVDGVILSPVPYYTQLSDELGGGAVGEAPFNFHQRTTAPPVGTVARDCSPYHTEALALAALDKITEVTISHYGPVYVDGTGPHFRVEYRQAYALPGQPLIWADKTSLFEVDTTKSGTDNASAQRTLVIKAAPGNTTGFKAAAGKWRIRPLTGKVKCGQVAGNPDVDYGSSVVSGDLGVTATGSQYSWYTFRTDVSSSSGMMLLSGGNGPAAADLSTWLAEPYEVNADGTTDSQDFIDMTDAYVAD